MTLLLLLLAMQSADVCRLVEADLTVNRTLSFQDFDQGGSDLSHTGWSLSMAKCHAESARADADYLLHGPALDDRQRVVVGWHMALSLAQAGREAEAAPLVAASVQHLPPEADGFDWNSYVRGVYGFLTKDRRLLEQSLATLRTTPGQRNAMNAQALSKLSRCFDRSYAEAVNEPVCATE